MNYADKQYLADLEVVVALLFIASAILAIAVIVLFVLWLRNRAKASKYAEKARRSEARLKDLELEALRFQMHPHTFRNTLTSIKYFADRTNRSLDILTDVLDYVLYDSTTGYVSMVQESAFLKRFIEFHQVQADDGRQFDLKIDLGEDSLLSEKKCIAPLVTAYFLENAVKHGKLKNEVVKVEMVVVNDTLNYHVVNAMVKGEKIDVQKGGVGQQNLRKRLEMIYPNSHQLMFKEEKGFYHAYLSIDLSKPVANA